MKQAILFFVLFFIGAAASAQNPEALLLNKGLVLPTATASIGNYTSLIRVGNLIYLSGKGPIQGNGKYIIGKLGKDLDTRQGYAAAQLCTLAQLAVLKAELGLLSKIKRIVKVTGFVNGTDTFTEQPKVLNGCSDLLVAIFGPIGIHTRSAVGVASLPGGWPVEVEMIVEVVEQ